MLYHFARLLSTILRAEHVLRVREVRSLNFRQAKSYIGTDANNLLPLQHLLK